jgi:phosphate transport system substrate-binding protein
MASQAFADVSGADASFPSNVYSKWGEKFGREQGVVVAYRPTGSSDGVKQISERAVQFGGTDSPLSPADLERVRLVQLPMVIGGIVPVVNLPGIAEAALQLNGPVLGDIMLGKVENWNDPRIVQLNGAIQLPSLPIRRIVRAERSGTAEGFSRYLSMSSSTFINEIGVSQLPAWPGEVVRAEGTVNRVQHAAD